MLTPRNLMTLFLLAALVPVALIGVANWRGTLQPGLASAVPAPAPNRRPQLGRSASPWSPTLGQLRSADGESFRTAGPSAEGRGRRDHAANAGPEAETANAMRFTTELQVSDQPRPPAQPPFGGLVGFGSSAPNPTTPGSTSGGDLAVVEFIGLTQDMKLLQQDHFMAELLRELKIVVWWDVPGMQGQRLELFSPDGTLYKRFSVQFDGDAGRIERRSSGGGRTPVETRLPVGGTWITEYSLFGGWRADVYLAGQATPVTSAEFFLNR